MDVLGDWIRPPKPFEAEKEMRGHPLELKTYLVENNSKSLAESFEYERTVGRISNTGLDKLKILTMSIQPADKKKTPSPIQFYLDMSFEKGRYLLLHTNYDADLTQTAITSLIDSGVFELDRAWFSTSMLKKSSEAPGNSRGGARAGYVDIFSKPDAEELVPENDMFVEARGGSSKKWFGLAEGDDYLRQHLGFEWVNIVRGKMSHGIKDEVRFDGRFRVTRGRSIGDHMILVENARDDYLSQMQTVEGMRIEGQTENGFSLIKGTPFEFRFTRKVESWEPFLSRIFDATNPFRVWGTKTIVRDRYYRILGVDMHTGHPLDIEVADGLFRVYLPESSCGNVVMRLLANLQRFFDSTMTCRQIGAS